eukprot:scaffold11521_cov68-Phaeocystis_antarctica.AAC.4
MPKFGTAAGSALLRACRRLTPQGSPPPPRYPGQAARSVGRCLRGALASQAEPLRASCRSCADPWRCTTPAKGWACAQPA